MNDMFEILAVGFAIAMMVAPVFLFVIVMRFISMKEKMALRRLQQNPYGGEKQ